MKASSEPTITELLSSLKSKLLTERSRIDRLLQAIANCEAIEPANGTPKEQGETIHIPGGASCPAGADVTVYREITPKRKYTPRKPKQEHSGTLTTTREAEARIEAELDAPITFGGAMKRVLREATSLITIATIWATIKTHWPDLLDGKDEGNIDANLRYWVSKGFADKLGAGQLATYKVIDSEFFKEVEA